MEGKRLDGLLGQLGFDVGVEDLARVKSDGLSCLKLLERDLVSYINKTK